MKNNIEIFNQNEKRRDKKDVLIDQILQLCDFLLLFISCYLNHFFFLLKKGVVLDEPL